jgi:hypothetical protein
MLFDLFKVIIIMFQIPVAEYPMDHRVARFANTDYSSGLPISGPRHQMVGGAGLNIPFTQLTLHYNN